MIPRRGITLLKYLTYTSVAIILLLQTFSVVPGPEPESGTSLVRMWVDIPNSFPWRYCLREYNGVTTLVACKKVGMQICIKLTIVKYLTICSFRMTRIKCLKEKGKFTECSIIQKSNFFLSDRHMDIQLFKKFMKYCISHINPRKELIQANLI